MSLYDDDNRLNRMRLLIDQQRNLSDDSHQQYDERQSSKENDLHLKISVLTSENQKLKTQYSDLIKKTNLLIDAYKKLEVENKSLKKKKEKRELFNNFLSGFWEGINNLTKKIILWFNT